MTDLIAPALPASTPLSDGPPLAIVLNVQSGHEDSDTRIATIRGLLKTEDRPYRLFTLSDPQRLPETIAQALAWAQDHRGAVVAAGGDGTINAAAQAVVPAGCPLGVLPQGTFNYFGRAHGMPTDTEVAVQLLLQARPRPIQVGLLNDRVFLVNASLGLYPKLLEDREAIKQRFGRSRFIAMIAGLWTILRTHHEWLIELDSGDEVLTAHTSTLFVGNNRLQLEQIGIPEAGELELGRLVAVMVKPMGRLAMLGLTLRGALGQLGEADRVLHFASRKLVVRPRLGTRVRRIKVAMDGEVLRLATPLIFTVSPKPLQLLVPPDSAL